MFSTFNFLDYVILFSGVILCFKKVAEMERYHRLRVVALTLILSFCVVLVFNCLWLHDGNPILYDGVSEDHFTLSEI